MVHSPQRGQATLEVIGVVLVLMIFAFLFLHFGQTSLQTLEKNQFSNSTKVHRP